MIKNKLFCMVLLGIVATLVDGCLNQTKTLDKWEVANEKFRIRITGYEEGSWTGGAKYIFQSASVGAEDWREITSLREDNPVMIPRNQVRFVNEQIGYFFMTWTCAVTTDSGSTWHVWNLEKDLPNWECCNYGIIRNVSINPNGTGRMELGGTNQPELQELRTTNFGQNWSKE